MSLLPFGRRNHEMVKAAETAMRKHRYAQELAARRPTSKVEMVARRYCQELGYDPDAPTAIIDGGRPLWTKYRDLAEAALHADAMRVALASVADSGAPRPDPGTDTTDNDLHRPR